MDGEPSFPDAASPNLQAGHPLHQVVRGHHRKTDLGADFALGTRAHAPQRRGTALWRSPPIGRSRASFENLQAVLQFRPATDEVIRVIDDASVQRDVDILDDAALAIFNNATQENLGKYTGGAHKYPVSKDQVELKRWYSRVERYDLASDTFTPLWEDLMRDQEIMTFSEGLQEFLPDGSVFLEEQNSGVLWVVSEEGVLFKDVQRSHHDGHHHLPNWTRIIPSTP